MYETQRSCRLGMGEGRAGASQGLTGRGKRQSAEAIALRGADDVPESGERWNSRGCVGVVGPFPFCFGAGADERQ